MMCTYAQTIRVILTYLLSLMGNTGTSQGRSAADAGAGGAPIDTTLGVTKSR